MKFDCQFQPPELPDYQIHRSAFNACKPSSSSNKKLEYHFSHFSALDLLTPIYHKLNGNFFIKKLLKICLLYIKKAVFLPTDALNCLS